MRGLTHCIAECQDCDHRWEDYLTAREQARVHAKRTGHYVTGEAAITFWYGRKAVHKPQKEE